MALARSAQGASYRRRRITSCRLVAYRSIQPLAGEKLERQVLSQAGQQGLKALPPDVADYIDWLKRERGI